MSDMLDFEINEDGIITEYYGRDTKIVIPAGIKGIDMYVFNNDDELEEVSIPDSIETIDSANFECCDNLKFNEYGGGYYLGNEHNPYLVLVFAEEGVTEFEIKDGCKIVFANAFANNERLTRVSFPESLKSIGFMAFYRCGSLTEITLPDGVKYIDAYAFSDCGLKKPVLPESLKRIGFGAFSSVSLEEISLPSGIEHIGHNAFNQNDMRFNLYEGGYYLGNERDPYICFMKPQDTDVEEICLHKSTRFIYSRAFNECQRLTSVTLPDGLLEIGQDAMSECCSLTEIAIPESVRVIGKNAFLGCESLRSISFPKSNLEIESAAFAGCFSLEDAELGEAIIGDNAFESCTSLCSFTAGEGSILYGDYIFMECTSLNVVTLPKSLEESYTAEEFADSPNVTINYV
jgi:hypothetical protein